MLITLCNMLYKIISKIIALRLNSFLSNSIYIGQLGFLRDKHIHQVVGICKKPSIQ